MRILILAPRPVAGEAPAAAYSVGDALAARGNQVFIASESTDPTRGAASGATYVPLPTARYRWWRHVRQVACLLRVIHTQHIHVVLSLVQTGGWMLWLVARLTRTPLLSQDALEMSLRDEARNPAVGDSDKDHPGLDTGMPGLHLESRATPVVHQRVRGRAAVRHQATRLELAARAAYVNRHRLEIPVLCYHRLVSCESESGIFDTHLHVDLFEEHLRYLREQGYRTIHFSDLDSSHVFDDRDRTVILTFDDGYQDNHRLLLPLLREYDAKATVFLVSRRTINEWDVAKGEQGLHLLNASERREMLDSGLVEFGAHTQTHPDLRTVTPEQALQEICQSKADLEAELGVDVHTFAYPYGHIGAGAKEAARLAGYRYAVATHSGPVGIHEDPFHVRRIVIFPGTNLRRFRRKVSGAYSSLVSSRSA